MVTLYFPGAGFANDQLIQQAQMNTKVFMLDAEMIQSYYSSEDRKRQTSCLGQNSFIEKNGFKAFLILFLEGGGLIYKIIID
jgi:hypothetical protein